MNMEHVHHWPSSFGLQIVNSRLGLYDMIRSGPPELVAVIG